MLPEFDSDGNLPPGIHWCSWGDLEDRFGFNKKRSGLLKGLRLALESLRQSGCETLYVDGSFTSNKENPGDFDACWDETNVDIALLDPVLLNFSNQRIAQKIKFGGELFPTTRIADGNSQVGFLDFFQTDKQTGKRKGVVALDLRSL